MWREDPRCCPAKLPFDSARENHFGASQAVSPLRLCASAVRSFFGSGLTNGLFTSAVMGIADQFESDPLHR